MVRAPITRGHLCTCRWRPFALCPNCDLIVLAIEQDFTDYTMSQVPSTSTSSQNFETIFTAALKEYKKQTKKDIASHPLAAELKSCDSPNAVLTVLQSQVRKFDPSESANERWRKLLDPTVNVLYAFSGFVSNITGPVNRATLSRFRTTLTHDHRYYHPPRRFSLGSESYSK